MKTLRPARQDVMHLLPGALLDGAHLLLHRQRIDTITPARGASPAAQDYELLLRIGGKSGAPQLPQALLQKAERMHLLRELDYTIIAMACAEIGTQVGAGERYSINLSGPTLVDPYLPDFLAEQLAQNQLVAPQLCLEITESVAIQNLTDARDVLHRLHTMGCVIALDDFGNGMSSFSYLKNLPIDILKIDGCFIKRLAADRVDQVLVEAMHRAVSALHMQSVAECVEDEASLNVLREIGVNFAQGFWLHRPEPFVGAAKH
jgi:EAL domain-containing protein (putative c-di-GMP-specific phosphodiesterase class I)